MEKIKQPNSKHCFICGIENPVGLRLQIYRIGEGEIETEYVAPDYFQGSRSKISVRLIGLTGPAS